MLQKSLFTTIASAKRGALERSGVHSWHPYYAGYSEAFVSSAIEYLNLDRSHVLLDPWNGSGTTALVASRLEIPTLGCDINPVMNIFACSKTGFLIKNSQLLIDFLNEIVDLSINLTVPIQEKDPLLDFMSINLARGLRSLYLNINSWHYPKVDVSYSLINFARENITFLNPFEAFLKAALFITGRELAGYKGGSNPTWIKTLSEKPDYSIEHVGIEFSKTVKTMLHHLRVSSLPSLDNLTNITIDADSRKLPFQDNCIDGIITSPPYLTRIDYAMSTKPEILMIGDLLELRKIREKTIGSPVIVDKNISIDPIWGKTCLEFLQNVESHNSKASRSYYLPNILQYFRDIKYSLIEIKRVLKHRGKALLVVQSSYFKEHEIDLGNIYVELCDNLGLDSQIVSREIVRNHMANVNKNSNNYKAGKVYHEDVVSVQKIK
ncbi:hypothetical protein V0288_04540 [Pannus brasiliensis CCIBt3594]|uniref:site-specific DNA-methyltransferase (cytosine-N(4)-specific) n=1 Tax=Pannus brasiliensis CCIBt3594 TaxID=1427578 RepID=A0AAW9QF41_9CHRO